jgi:hypothetical protein
MATIQWCMYRDGAYLIRQVVGREGFSFPSTVQALNSPILALKSPIGHLRDFPEHPTTNVRSQDNQTIMHIAIEA